MRSDSNLDGVAGPFISARVRKTILSIKEIVGNHSDADIYAVLKETNMDPNETAQKLLNQDPFHEVRRKRDKRKGFSGYKVFDTSKSTETMLRGRSNRSMNFNVCRGDFRISKEFRVVRDNRVNQDVNKDITSKPLLHSPGKEHDTLSISDKRSSQYKHFRMVTSKNMNAPCSCCLNHEYDLDPSARCIALPPEELKTITESATSERQVVVPSSYPMDSSFISTTFGVCSSSSDPVHVPSPVSLSPGTVEVIPLVIGAVGVRKEPSGSHVLNRTVSNNCQAGKVNLPSKGFHEDLSVIIKSSQPSSVSSSLNAMPTTSTRRYASVQYNSRQHLHAASHQRAMQPNMEWKPKKLMPRTDTLSTLQTSSIQPLSDDNALGSYLVADTNLSDKLLHARVYGDQHVIFPRHLRVPESECTQLTFGSFGAGSDSTKTILPALQTIESSQGLNLETSISNSPSLPVGHNGKTSAEAEHLVDCQAGLSRSASNASAEALERTLLENDQPLRPQNIESYADVGLVRSDRPPYSSQSVHQIQDITSVPNFSAYNSSASYVAPFSPTIFEDNVHGQSSATLLEARSSHAMNNISTAFVVTQPNQASQQLQQAVPQLYSQVHVPHYTNFMPYRHIFSPVYVPPMAMTNYSSNPAYAHPSNGNNYLLMPGGSSHLPAVGMKYAPPQYKPVHAGSPSVYGSYSTPAAFAIGTPSSLGGTTGHEDMTRIKYKDNSLYAPNQQAEASDMWIQTPRELPGLQSTPYFNLPGHAAHSTTFVSGQAAAAGAPNSPVHFPAVYHAPQPASITSPHPLVHQQVPAAMGLGAAGSPQVGAFPHSQLGHLNWTANF